MAKPKSPLLSFGAKGTIADTLTFQKRGKLYYARQKPTPIDPKSQPQLAQRQRYKDAVAVWNALSPAEKEAWRGVCPGLTAYQCFMRSELKYPPPPIPIDIGQAAIDRAVELSPFSTWVNIGKTANASGLITSVEIWATLADLAGCKVGIFYTTGVNKLKCRSAATIGAVVKGAKRTFAVSLEVQAGDYIGIYWSAGYLEWDMAGYAGAWEHVGDYCIVGAEAVFAFYLADAISLHGIGETQP